MSRTIIDTIPVTQNKGNTVTAWGMVLPTLWSDCSCVPLRIAFMKHLCECLLYTQTCSVFFLQSNLGCMYMIYVQSTHHFNVLQPFGYVVKWFLVGDIVHQYYALQWRNYNTIYTQTLSYHGSSVVGCGNGVKSLLTCSVPAEHITMDDSCTVVVVGCLW